MSGKQIVLWLVLVDFLACSAWVVAQVGYLGFFELAMANWATRLLAFDLVIALSLFTVWMVRDARERGLSVAPYVVATLALGSAGPLLYLIRRERSAAPQVAAARA